MEESHFLSAAYSSSSPRQSRCSVLAGSGHLDFPKALSRRPSLRKNRARKKQKNWKRKTTLRIARGPLSSYFTILVAALRPNPGKFRVPNSLLLFRFFFDLGPEVKTQFSERTFSERTFSERRFSEHTFSERRLSERTFSERISSGRATPKSLKMIWETCQRDSSR